MGFGLLTELSEENPVGVLEAGNVHLPTISIIELRNALRERATEVCVCSMGRASFFAAGTLWIGHMRLVVASSLYHLIKFNKLAVAVVAFGGTL